jgi:hypothetical protein
MIIEQEGRVNNFIFIFFVHLFLTVRKMDTVDFQIPDGGPPQELSDPRYLTRQN